MIDEKKYKLWLYMVTGVTCVLVVSSWSILPVGIYLFNQTPSNNSTDLVTRCNTTELAYDCREDFYRDNFTGCCVPDCHNWTPYKASSDILLATHVIGLVLCIIVLTVSGIRAKKVLTFPTALVVYMTINVAIRSLLFNISFSQSKWFCSSRSYLQSLHKITTFCTLSGIINSYGSYQIMIWLLCHAAALFWKIRFPLRARSFTLNKKDKYLHLFSLLAGLFLPVIPIIATIADSAARYNTGLHPMGVNISLLATGLGFRPDPGLSICAGGSEVAVYLYSIILCSVIPSMMSLVILVCYYIHKQYILIKTLKLEQLFKFSSTELKLLIFLGYYFFVYIISILIAGVFQHLYISTLTTNVSEYLACEQEGHNPDDPCDESVLQQSASVVQPLVTLLLTGLSPLVHLMYVVNIRELKEKCGVCARRLNKIGS